MDLAILFRVLGSRRTYHRMNPRLEGEGSHTTNFLFHDFPTSSYQGAKAWRECLAVQATANNFIVYRHTLYCLLLNEHYILTLFSLKNSISSFSKKCAKSGSLRAPLALNCESVTPDAQTGRHTTQVASSFGSTADCRGEGGT